MHFLKSLTLATALLLASPALHAQKAATKKVAKAASPKSSLLWEISGNKLTKPSYLYGTIHLLCADDLLVSEALKKAIASTEQVAMEIDMDSPTMMEEMQARMMLPAGESVQGCLTKEEYTAVNDYYTNQLHMPFAQMGTLKPFILASLLYPKMLECTPGSYEKTFVELAQAQKKEVIGLETVAEQMAIFDAIPCDKQAHMLAEMVNNYAGAQQEFRDLVKLYKTQDVEALRTMSNQSKFGLNEYEAILLTNRNKRWIPLIAQQAAAKPTFFAVGAAHLGGTDGVLALLRQQGYQVKAVQQ